MSSQRLEDLKIVKSGLESDLKKVGLEWESRVYADKIVAGMDQLLEDNKNASTTTFNRALFNHILEFQNIDRNNPILIEEFMNSYFLVYDSMKENKAMYSTKCKILTENITKISQKLEILKQKEQPTEDGRTTTSAVKVELKLIQVFQDLEDVILDHVFNNAYVLVEADGSDPLKIPISQATIDNQPSFEIDCKDLNKKFTLSYFGAQGKQKLDEFYPRDSYDFYVPKSYEIEDKGIINFNIIFINSKVDFWSKKIIEYEANFHDSQVTFENLGNSIVSLEEPFSDFMISHNRNKAHIIEDPSEYELGRKTPGYTAQFEKKEIEVSEKIEKIILGVSGRKHIIWETIFFLFNKIMLGCVILVLLSRGDFATFVLGLIGLGFETYCINYSKFGKHVFALFITLLYDFAWVCVNLLDWADDSLLEGPSLTTMRRLSIVMSFVVLIVKIILVFAGWRINIVYKIKKSNPYRQKTEVKAARAVNVRVPIAEEVADDKQGRKRRPVINYENTKEQHIRFVESII